MGGERKMGYGRKDERGMMGVDAGRTRGHEGLRLDEHFQVAGGSPGWQVAGIYGCSRGNRRPADELGCIMPVAKFPVSGLPLSPVLPNRQPLIPVTGRVERPSSTSTD